ncbi:MAG: tRNA pseudouridine(55) synthase TruB [Chloroflexota bacterium]
MSHKRYPPRPELTGILNINKPKGPSSHDVVDAIRRAARVRRVGHAGTLDPLATGVLLVCLDQATRVSQYLMDSIKVYHARIRLGQTTNTDDAEGQIVAQTPLPDHLEPSHIRQALADFVGQIEQVPPQYAAIKKNGAPLYKLARQGVAVELPPRQVTIHTIDLLEWQPPHLVIDIRCGPGTYVRALARDLGARLGCGGHLSELVRTQSGHFAVQDAIELDDALGRLRQPDTGLENMLHPIDAALADLPCLRVDAETEKRLRQGQQIHGPAATAVEQRRVYGPDGVLIAIVQYHARTGLWQPHAVFDLRPS